MSGTGQELSYLTRECYFVWWGSFRDDPSFAGIFSCYGHSVRNNLCTKRRCERWEVEIQYKQSKKKRKNNCVKQWSRKCQKDFRHSHLCRFTMIDIVIKLACTYNLIIPSLGNVMLRRDSGDNLIKSESLVYLEVLFAWCPSQLLHETHNVKREFKIGHSILRGKNSFYHALEEGKKITRKVEVEAELEDKYYLLQREIKKEGGWWREGEGDWLPTWVQNAKIDPT